MCTQNDKSHVEAWKSLIELSKTTLSISSAVLTALIGFYVLNQSSFSASKINYMAPALLVLSILIAIYGFGRAIRSIKTGTSEPAGVGLTNTSVILLVAGILSTSLIEFNNNKSLDVVLANIEKESATFETKLSPKFMKKVEVVNSNYLVIYEAGAKTTNITYSQNENRIIKVE